MSIDVLVVEDDAPLRLALTDTLGLTGYSVEGAGSGAEALGVLAQEPVGLLVSDIQMRPMDGIALMREVRSRYPQVPVLLMTAYATVQQAVEAMRIGAADYLVKPFEAEVLVSKVAEYLRPAAPGEDEPVAADPASRELLELAGRVAESDATVLISGPSGVGKEVVARYIHRHSARVEGPFVAINCAAIPENMLEAVLFGYEKGAFTGAYKSSPGKFEQAQGGTLLLDEVSEMALGLQAKLLRVLQEREVERLGGRGSIALDLRVLATSNRDMRREVDEARFREDLYYRLNVFPLAIPPLSARRQDIVPLAERLAGRAARAAGQVAPALTEAARTRLIEHAWPGNVRELDNVMQRAMILRRGDRIDAGDLHFEQVALTPGGAPVQAAAGREVERRLDGDLRLKERELIAAALADGNGSRKRAAEKLGISPRTLRYKLQRLREEGLGL